MHGRRCVSRVMADLCTPRIVRVGTTKTYMPLSRRTIKLFGTVPVEEGNSFGRPKSVAFRLPVSSSLDFQKRVWEHKYFVYYNILYVIHLLNVIIYTKLLFQN